MICKGRLLLDGFLYLSTVPHFSSNTWDEITQSEWFLTFILNPNAQKSTETESHKNKELQQSQGMWSKEFLCYKEITVAFCYKAGHILDERSNWLFPYIYFYTYGILLKKNKNKKKLYNLIQCGKRTIKH
jgi:hypothetical protein